MAGSGDSLPRRWSEPRRTSSRRGPGYLCSAGGHSRAVQCGESRSFLNHLMIEGSSDLFPFDLFVLIITGDNPNKLYTMFVLLYNSLCLPVAEHPDSHLRLRNSCHFLSSQHNMGVTNVDCGFIFAIFLFHGDITSFWSDTAFRRCQNDYSRTRILPLLYSGLYLRHVCGLSIENKQFFFGLSFHYNCPQNGTDYVLVNFR